MKILLLPVLLFFFQPALAEPDFDAGMAAYEAGEHAEAFAIFEVLAQQGNPWAQHNLGLMYVNGYGVEQDDEQAFHWYLRAAEQGNASAQAMVGTMYFLGQGVGQDNIEAYKWHSIAAAQASDENLRNTSTTLKNDIEKEMTGLDLFEAQQRVADWQP